MLIKKLSGLVRTNDLSKAEFESIVCQLTPQQERLYLFLSENEQVDTITLNKTLFIANISSIALLTNKRLKAQGLDKKIICLLKRHVNQFGDAGVIGVWQIVDKAVNDE